MSGEVRVDLDIDQIFQEANLTDQVDAGLRQRAQQVANRAHQIDNAENGGKSRFEIQEGRLPNGRRWFRVAGEDTGQEYGKQNVSRRSILRRASGGGTRG